MRTFKNIVLATPSAVCAAVSIALFLLLSCGCESADSRYIRVDAIKPSIDSITTEYDAYVQADENLQPAQKEAKLFESAQLRALVEDANRRLEEREDN